MTYVPAETAQNRSETPATAGFQLRRRSEDAMSRKLAAEFFGTFWLVFGASARRAP